MHATLRPDVTRVQYDKDDAIVHAGEDVSSKINHCLGILVYLEAGIWALDVIGRGKRASRSGQPVYYLLLPVSGPYSDLSLMYSALADVCYRPCGIDCCLLYGEETRTSERSLQVVHIRTHRCHIKR